jgi:segregation and condensation protein B
MSEIDIFSDLPLDNYLEAILFVADGPISVAQIAEILKKKQGEIEKSLKALEAHLKDGHGLRLQWHGNKVQLTTAPELADVIERFLGLEAATRLTRASLETLAIIAYKQPITRPGIDMIRGVNSDGVLKSLLFKGLVEEMGRAEGPGRPILYGTTPDFLQHFGISSLEELPPFEVIIDSVPEQPGNNILKD